MSWAAHQFEGYVLQRHFGSRVRISYLAIVAGDLLPDKFVKAWTYGFTIGHHHYGASDPATFHRSWPGGGFTHSMAFGAAIASIVWFIGRKRPWGVPWAIGLVVGQWAHVLTDINDTKGTMLLFPFTTHNFSIGTWAYAAQVGRHADAAAYMSSLGFVMDVVWLAILVIFCRNVLTRTYFETAIRPADPAIWSRMGRRLSADSLFAIYLCMFAYGMTRLISWTVWAHTIGGYSWDLSWGGPDWVAKVPASHQSAAWVVVGVLGVSAAMAVFSRFVLRPARLAPSTGSRPVEGGSPWATTEDTARSSY